MPNTYQIMIDNNGAATSSPTVMPGDQVYWTAGSNSAGAYINLPTSILSGNPTSPVNLAANGSSPTYTMNASQGVGEYTYSTGIQGQNAVTDTIYVGRQIVIDANGAATSSPTVMPGDKVYWLAGANPAGVYVNLPSIFSGNPSSPVNIAANAVSSTYTVNNGQPSATYHYSSGIQGQARGVTTVNDTIDVGAGTEGAAAGKR